ncbi:MAG: XdhC family protein [Dehalococcoidia bacterium]
MTNDVETRMQIMGEIEEALGGGPSVVVATVVNGGELGLPAGAKLLVHRDGSTVGGIDPDVDATVAAAGLEAYEAFPRIPAQTLWVHHEGGVVKRRHQSRPGDAQLMVELFEAPARLLVVGGGHVGLSIARIGAIVGFSIAVLDDRPEFANPERFPMAEEVMCGDIAEELDGTRIDHTTFIVLVSRGHMQDALALRHTVSRGPAYLGMIGSRRRTATVLQQLRDEGYSADDLARVHTPIGLDINAETPEEIALAILAEIVLIRKGGTGRMLSTITSRRAAEAT